MKKYPLPEIIRAFKTYSSRGINEIRHSPGTTVWQRSFYEHIIRGEKDFREIGEYIVYNPAKWESDDENPGLLTK
jgi:putative transposase